MVILAMASILDIPVTSNHCKATISPKAKQAKLYKKRLAFASLFCMVERGFLENC